MALKSSDKPVFSKKWWATAKPADIKGSELEKALAGLEKALAEDKKRKNQEAVDASVSALEEFEAALEKTINKECDKKKHKDAISVLDKFYNLIKDERERLEECKDEEESDEDDGEEGDEDDEDEGKLFDKDYLVKMIKIMRSSGKTLNFGFGLNTGAPEASDLLLKRKGKPEMLFKALKKTGKYSNRTMVCGTALSDPDNGKVLMLNVEEGDEPPQILKLGRKFLRGNKDLKFRKLKVVIGGKTLVDSDPDDEDQEGAPGGGAAAMQGKLRSATAAAGIWTRTKESVTEQIDKLRAELEGFDDVDVQAVRKRLEALDDRYPKLDFTALVGAADPAAFDRVLQETRGTIVQWRHLLDSDKAMRTIDENPFVSTNVVSTYGDALASIEGELKL